MIIWDKEKNEWLKKQRGISFDEIANIIEDGNYLGFLENPARKDQYLFVVALRGYAYTVPCLFDESDNIVLKTAYPNRKFYKKYKDFI